MSVVKLSKRTVDGLVPGAKAYIAFDAALKGFGVRVLPTGAKSWIIAYRPGGGGRAVGKRRLKLGDVGELTPDEARQPHVQPCQGCALVATLRRSGRPCAVRSP
jgi:hypothetical protein